MDTLLDVRYQAVAIILVAVLGVLVFLYLRFFYVDFARIRGLPEIPNGSLIAGHLYMLGNDHASTAERWALSNLWPVYQIRFGNRRAIILNSFDAAREFIVTRQTATTDRPRLYTFHGVVSKTSASTIGMNPWNERTKKQRRVVGSYTTGPEIRKLQPMLDLETCDVISSLYEDSKKGALEIMPHIYQKKLALNIMMMFCYGRRFSDINDPLLLGILSDANTISTFRSTNSNAQDYIPYLRLGIFKDKKRAAVATEVRRRRDTWLAELLENAREKVKLGSGKLCVAQGLLVDDEEKLTKHDIRTILGGLMSGGFETVFSTAIIGIGFLCSPAGQAIQQRAYEDIMSHYGSVEEAFAQGVLEEKSTYISAFVRETLRFYPPLHLLPPRQTYQEFSYQGATIPKGILVYINAQAINHDKTKYGSDADQFRPNVGLKRTPDLISHHPTTSHSGQELTTPPPTHYINYNRDTTGAGAIPKDFMATFQPRDAPTLEKCIQKSQEATFGLAN